MMPCIVEAYGCMVEDAFTGLVLNFSDKTLERWGTPLLLVVSLLFRLSKGNIGL